MFGPFRLISLSSLFLLSIGTASANNFSYNALDIRVGAGPTTLGATYSMQFTENAHIIARFDSEFDNDYDIAGGFGFNGPMTQFSDITGQMLIHNIKSDSDEIIGDKILTEFNMGVRAWMLENIEAHGKIGQLVGEDSHFLWEAGARFHSTPQLVLGVSLLDNGVYGSQFMMKTRFHF